MTLREQFELKKAEARKAYEAGDVERGDTLKAEAETLKAALDGTAAVDGMEAPAKTTMRPPLPGVGGGSMPQANGDGQNGTQAQNEPVVAEGNPLKAAYVKQFGEPDAVAKSILTDLHGPNYVEAYWAQKAAFRKYLRYGESRLTADDHKSLSTIVFTPTAVMAALDQGIDDIRTFKATMVEAVDTLGGYTVPVDFQARVIERLRGLTAMRGRASQTNTSRDALEFPVATGGNSQYSSAVRVTWVDETPAAAAAETNLTFGMERIPIHTVMASTPLSRNFVEDSAVNIEAYLTEKFAEAAAIDEDNQFLTGDGNGRPQGILPSSGNGLSLTEENSGNASALTWNGLIGLTYAIDAQYRQNAVFIGEKATYEAIAKLTDGGGQYLWRRNYGDQVTEGGAGRMGTLMGYPVLEQEALPTIAASAYPLIFGDLRGYQIVDRVGMTVERFLDATTAEQNYIKYVMRRRLGGQVLETWRFAVQKVSA